MHGGRRSDRRGVFRGCLTPNPKVEKAPGAGVVACFDGRAPVRIREASKKYKLDAPSACKLAEATPQKPQRPARSLSHRKAVMKM